MFLNGRLARRTRYLWTRDRHLLVSLLRFLPCGPTRNIGTPGVSVGKTLACYFFSHKFTAPFYESWRLKGPPAILFASVEPTTNLLCAEAQENLAGLETVLNSESCCPIAMFYWGIVLIRCQPG